MVIAIQIKTIIILKSVKDIFNYFVLYFLANESHSKYKCKEVEREFVMQNE